MRTHDSVLAEIRPIVADVLAVEPQEVTPEARFFEDLGGESIDLLDVSFRFEKHFGARMPIQQIATSEDIVTDESGRLTDEALAMLKAKYPFLDYSRLEANPMKSRISELFTISALAGFVLSMLGQNSSPEPA
jgi:acyl carrier protein